MQQILLSIRRPRVLSWLSILVALVIVMQLGCGGVHKRTYTTQTFVRASTNPLLQATQGAWDSQMLESPMVILDGNTYYMFYHADNSPKSSYQIGLATAKQPLGPWIKYGHDPILSTGPHGAWDDFAVAVGQVMKIDNTWYMWYMGQSSTERRGKDNNWPWRIGLATASAPDGPWVKYKGNPVLDIGEPGGWDSVSLYLASVTRVGNTYYLWYVGFQVGTDQDGQLGLATAPTPEGPWTKYEGNPVLTPGPAGSWDAGQIGEAAIVYRDGMFHAWYAGYPQKNIRQADMGYAYSADGMHWTKLATNPVLTRGSVGEWDQDRISEPHVLIDGRSIYLFFTGARYLDSGMEEALGVAVGKLY